MDHGVTSVLAPYQAGSTTIHVDNVASLLIKNTKYENCALLNLKSNEHIHVSNSHTSSIHVAPTKGAGSIGDQIGQVKSNVHQGLMAQQPSYRRNVCNFMPSLRFAPPQMLSFEEGCLLENQLSGPADATEFTMFFVTKTYCSMGSSPWPLFTAIDTENNWSYSIQAVMEQRNNENLEARWKISFGTVICHCFDHQTSTTLTFELASGFGENGRHRPNEISYFSSCEERAAYAALCWWLQW